MKFISKEVQIEYLLDNIKATYERTNDKSDLFTPQHIKYACSISNEKGVYSFTYQCNPNYTKPTKKSLIACVLSDARSYQDSVIGSEEDNLQEFANMFGYDNDFKALMRAFKGCKEASEKISKMLSQEEQELLYNYFIEEGEI